MSSNTENVVEVTPVTTQLEDRKPVFVERMRKIPCMGLAMALCSGICMATSSLTVELMKGDTGTGIDASLVVAGRSLVEFLFLLPLALILKYPLLGVQGERKYVITRGCFGFGSFALTYYALAHLSLSDSQSILFSSPIFTYVFACVILKEACGVFQIIMVITTMTGVMLIARPTFLFSTDTMDNDFKPEDRVIGTIMSLGAALTMSFSYVMIRKAKKTPAVTVVTIFSFFGLTLGALVFTILKFSKVEVHIPKGTRDFGLLVANGICGVVGQSLMVLSLQIEEAGLVSLMRTIDIVLAFVYQISFLGQKPTLLSIGGAIIIFGTCVACALKKYFDARPEVFERYFKCCKREDTLVDNMQVQE